MQCLVKVVDTCAESSLSAAHFDASVPLATTSGALDRLVDRLPDLIRVAFIAATSAIDEVGPSGALVHDIQAPFPCV